MPTDPLAHFHPVVRAWFTETLGAPSAPQRAGWPVIASGADTLILAPTGTGKTLAAFLWEVNALITEGLERPLANAVHLLYISPLKALNNDVQKNLELPLAQLKARFGPDFPDIRVAVRTGDTPASARARMLRRTPHILITTPESLHILLTSVRGRTMFSALRAVIVDEIHAVAGTKRGAHLALTLERLSRVAPAAPQRIGLSATQKPLDEIARFLSGCDAPAADGTPRFHPVEIVDCGLVKKMETRIVAPVPDLAQVDGTIWTKVMPLVLERIRGARTTLVFVNNRGQSERMAARLNALAEEEIALPYHGSLSRERRLLLEERLKAGELRALVTTSSLELGIDVGSVDLVVQVQSPKRVSAALQRVGRAGHSLDATSRGLFVPTFRDDALELLVLLDAMRTGDVEPTRVVQNALDVLAQLIVAIVASETPEWTSADLFNFVRRAYPFHVLSRAAFDETLEMLAGKYPSDVNAELDARLSWDRISDVLTPARASRMVATISGGTIPDRGLYAVQLGDKTRLGELDEEFVHESRVGDAFQLGSSTWRIQAIEHDRVIVIPAPGAPARMPFWHGEFMARSYHLSARIGELRRSLEQATTPKQLETIGERYSADENTVRSLAEYMTTQRAVTEIVPDETHLVLEHFRDEVGGVRLVLHAPFGARVNAPWGMALGRRLREQLGVDVQVQTTDDGVMLRLPDLGTAPPLDTVRSLGAEECERLVLEEVAASSLFGARFRMNAARALLLPRGNPRKRMPLWLQRLKAADLLQAVQEYPSFPIVVETYREVLQDAFDMAGLRQVLTRLSAGAISIRTIETKLPSPFSTSLQFGFVMDWMYGDDTPRAERRASLLSLDRALLDELMGGEGADESTLAVLAELLARKRGTAPGRQARDADELALLVDRAGDVTLAELEARVAPPAEWRRGNPIEALLASGRLIGITLPAEGANGERFILVDAYARYVAAFGADFLATVRSGVTLDQRTAADVVPAPLRNGVLPERVAQREVLSRWISLAGVFSIDDVRARYDFDAHWIERRLADAEQRSVLVRGTFGAKASGTSNSSANSAGNSTRNTTRNVTRWCTRKLLEQARRRELSVARRAIQAVPLDRFARFMQRWQHLAPGAQWSGHDAVARALSQLHGVARIPELWEREYLPARILHFNGSDLARLAASGALVWAFGPPGRLRYFERGTGRQWLGVAPDVNGLSDRARQIRDVLVSQGASFTSDLSAANGMGPQATRDAIKELVAAGVVTNDTVEALRDLLRWQSALPTRRLADAEPDPARWLPADFKPSEHRPFGQRRPNPRRVRRWRRQDWESSGAPLWGGRWGLVHTPGPMGPDVDGQLLAERIARKWLDRYGIVSREFWKVERPPVSWRDIYHQLKRLEFRGDVQRGYFVAGLAGAQFALPDAVELLRSEPVDGDNAMVVMLASDPANVYALPVAKWSDATPDPLGRPRGTSAMLVTRAGRIILTAEGRGARLRVRTDAIADDVRDAARALGEKLSPKMAAHRRRELVVDSIDGERATRSPWVEAFRAAGYRSVGVGLTFG